MLNKTLREAIDKLIAAVPKAQRARLKAPLAVIDQARLPAEVHPTESLRVGRFQLKLTWANGHELLTDDYAVAAAYVGYAAKTLVIYLTQAGGTRQFTDPHDAASVITVAKVPRAQPTTVEDVTRSWVYLQHGSCEGFLPIEDAAKYLRRSPMAVRRQLTTAHGRWSLHLQGELATVLRLAPGASRATCEKHRFTPPRQASY
jgi:hypothetical protein